MTAMDLGAGIFKMEMTRHWQAYTESFSRMANAVEEKTYLAKAE